MLAVALALGLEPHGDALQWLAVIGLLARTPEAANAFTFVVMFLPYMSSAFVPTATMPEALRAFAGKQRVPPIIETLRGLMMETSSGGYAAGALAWCLGAVILGVTLATAMFKRRTAI